MTILERLKRKFVPSRLQFDLIILWDWEYDGDFVAQLTQTAIKKRLHVQAFGPGDLEAFAKLYAQEDFTCRLIVDRASDNNPGLSLFLASLKSRGTYLINDPRAMAWCRDKATMHLELLNIDVRVPYGIIVSTEDHPESMHVLALAKLGTPFVIKPSEGGGGEGVVLDAVSSHDISSALKTSETGKIILQQKVIPKILGAHRGWFRVFYILGQVIPCWWDDLTHLYSQVQPEELETILSHKIIETVQRIAKISHIDFFTTEIAVDQNGDLLVVDFINEMCDMRLKSRHVDGVPDTVAANIVDEIIRFCLHLKKVSH